MQELLHRSRKIVRDNRQFLQARGLNPRNYVLLTVHRAANVDNRENLVKLIGIIEAIPYPVLFPVHPRTQKRFRRFRLWSRFKSIPHAIACEPLSYLDTLSAALYSRVVLTDSGGLQKEAVFLGKPVLTLRDETAWVNTLRRGNRLVGLNREKVLRSLRQLPRVHAAGYRVNGKTPSQIIVSAIADFVAGR